MAHIAVEFGGAAVSCGPLVEEVAFNEFVLPRASRDEPRNSVYHYTESGDALEFMRIKLRAVDAAAKAGRRSTCCRSPDIGPTGCLMIRRPAVGKACRKAA